MSSLNMTAFERLNQLTPSPGVSPANGPDHGRDDLTLSFPVSGSELQASLEAWTTRTFNFDGDFAEFGDDIKPDDAVAAGQSAYLGQDSLHAAAAAAAAAATVSSSPSSTSPFARLGADAHTDLDALLQTPAIDSLDTLPGVDEYSHLGTSLVDPALSLPHFNLSANVPGLLMSTGTQAPPAIAVTTPSTAASTPAASTLPTSGKKPAVNRKRKQSGDASTSGDADDEANRVALEEDKRRRNTAASARFRMKKKAREAALEQSAKELQDKVAQLESEILGLRTENQRLRSLITDKSGAGNDLGVTADAALRA
ncbi:hypothetical protein OIV83_003741 [Microbotryomycetes sp. JL201]|nr:hypothetical protein OIV83_003741 [Microbotryomycetes sp. JL201]